MIFSETKKFVFLHNPKCAGTSFRMALKKFDTRKNYYWHFDDLNGHKIDKAHMPLHIFRKYSQQDFQLLDSYFVFGFVRNPYNRAISAFNEIHQPLYRKLKADEVNFSEYQDALNAFINQLTLKKVSGWDFRYRHFVRQTDIFWLEKKLYADVVIKVEDLNNNLNKLSFFRPEVGLHLSRKIKNRNEKPMPYKPEEILSKESISVINKVYFSDFLLFDYPMIDAK